MCEEARFFFVKKAHKNTKTNNLACICEGIS